MFDLNDTPDATVSADTDDLDNFATDFFGTKTEAPVTETVDDPDVNDSEDNTETKTEVEPVEGEDTDEVKEVKAEPKKNRVQDRINQLLER